MERAEKKHNKQSIRALLDSNGIKASKSLGQNFLVDSNIPEKIVKLSGIDKSCTVLEVGPGLGALTAELGRAAGYVTAVELDKRFVPILQDMFKEQKNVSIIQGDILKLNIKDLLKDRTDEPIRHVCANLPYNITTPAITAFIEAEMFTSITVMIQKEVAERICAKPGTSEYGAFTVYANYHSKPEILFDVSPECFSPRPKVTSSVVKMELRTEQLLQKNDEKMFFKIVRAAFGQRRKTLVNALYAVFEKTHTKELIEKAVISSGFDPRVRGEVLGIEDFASLSQLL